MPWNTLLSLIFQQLDFGVYSLPLATLLDYFVDMVVVNLVGSCSRSVTMLCCWNVSSRYFQWTLLSNVQSLGMLHVIQAGLSKVCIMDTAQHWTMLRSVLWSLLASFICKWMSICGKFFVVKKPSYLMLFVLHWHLALYTAGAIQVFVMAELWNCP